MIDFKIKAVLNPKGKKSSQGETIYLCINRKIRQYINLGLEKIPEKAWSGKTLKWVNSYYPYAESHNRTIARAIHNLKEIIEEHSRRNEILTSEKLKKIYQVKFQGKRIKGVDGIMAPGASDTIISYIDYFLNSDRTSKLAYDTKKVYHTLKKQMERFRIHASMAEINEEFMASYVDFLLSEKKVGVTVEKYVDRLKKIYREYCDQYEIPFKARYFDSLDIPSDEGSGDITYLKDDHYKKLKELKFSKGENRLEITRDLFILLCNTSLLYKDLIRLEPKTVFDENLIKINPEYLVLKGERRKNGEKFWIPLNESAKQIFFKYYCEDCQNIFPSQIAISEQKFNLALKTLANKIGFTEKLSNKVGRKTFGTWADRLGMEENDIKMIFGHSPGSILKKHYTERRTQETYLRIIGLIER
ncbi:phage integrase SAM-like domain-containing protein [Litoribacter alkaliphilus]|uniref:Phage integrase SAM-like domain-containing protein n=1 Tax=Litoribacter ruber TaxID=702568 RepID=A0AAP2CFB6_9BACT|nr:tyrosine-type recombinase/integrase [Litoribacter alkaliphilus]MBS9522389.1 phage integrase SAM-like domain-containing protein [Litoribacter alkaliphilus]